jgi:hypothetical protein
MKFWVDFKVNANSFFSQEKISVANFTLRMVFVHLHGFLAMTPQSTNFVVVVNFVPTSNDPTSQEVSL